MAKFFFNKAEFYSEGTHPFSSASRDIVDIMYDLIAPAMFHNITQEQVDIINRYYAVKDSYHAIARLIEKERENKSLNQDIYFQIANIRAHYIQETFFIKPQGSILSVEEVLTHPDCQFDEELTRDVYSQIVFPFTTQDLIEYTAEKNRKFEERNEQTLLESFAYLVENPNKKFWPWCIDNSQFRHRGE